MSESIQDGSTSKVGVEKITDTVPVPPQKGLLPVKDQQVINQPKDTITDSRDILDSQNRRTTTSARTYSDFDYLPHLEKTKYNEQLDPFQQIVKRDLALHLRLLKMHVTSETLNDIFQLFEMHICSLMSNLQKITNVQRRKKAAPKDLELLLRNCQIRTGELEEEFERSQKALNDDLIKQKTDLEKLSEKLQYNQEEELDANDPSYSFFVQDHEIYNLVPSTYSNKNQKAIPVFLPEFPPDHTYRKSPIYLNQIPDQKTMRSKLVEESRFVGEAIDKLMVSNKEELKEQEDFEKQRMAEIESNKHKPRLKVAEKLGYDIWNFTDKKLDIPAYAKARLEYLRRKKEREDKLLPEERAIYTELIANLSPYAKVDEKKRTIGDVIDPSAFLSKLHKESLLSVKILKKRKAEREEKRKELQKKAEIERMERLKEEKRLAKEARIKEAENAAKEAKYKAASTVETFDDFENFGNTDFDNFDSFADTNNGELHFDFGEEKEVDIFGEVNKSEIKESKEGDIEILDSFQDILEEKKETEKVNTGDKSSEIQDIEIKSSKEDEDEVVKMEVFDDMF